MKQNWTVILDETAKCYCNIWCLLIIKESVDVLHVFKINHSSNAINGNESREDVGRMKEYNETACGKIDFLQRTLYFI